MSEQTDKCKERVQNEGRWPGSHQCSYKVWKDGYCKIHHPEMVEARRAAADKRYEEKRKLLPSNQLYEAQKQINELKIENTMLRDQLAMGRKFS